MELYENTDPLTLAGEVWKPVVGYESSYEVSSLGRVRRLARMCDPGNRSGWNIQPSIVKQQTATKEEGRQKCTCVLVCNGRRRASTPGKLVYESFVGPVPDGYTVQHSDGNTLNNRIGNICLCDGSWRIKAARRSNWKHRS